MVHHVTPKIKSKTGEKIKPKLVLVGAGPGDPDLITMKGIQAIGKADAILYDALVNQQLLQYAKPSAKKIYVGKRKGQHSVTQEQINHLIVELAFTHGMVVRLKGGDPFVFGRGYEEIAYARTFNIQTEIIPGISSSTGVPASVGIPLTHRGMSESFWVLTGTSVTGKLARDIKLAVQSKATVLILMGIHKLHEIIEIYQEFGKTNLPVAIIQNGTLPEERIVTGTISTIEKSVKEKQIESPAIIMIGETVTFHPEFESANRYEKILSY